MDSQGAHASGQRLQEQQKWADAEAAFRRGLADDPKSVALRLKIAETLVQRNKPAAIGKVLSPALSILKGRLPPPQSLQRFQILAMLRKYPELLKEGARLLTLDRSPETFRVLQWPWGLVWPDRGAGKQYFAVDVERLGPLAAHRWCAYYRDMLLRRTGRADDAAGLSSLDCGAKKDAWMGFEIGRARLYERDFKRALRAFRSYLAAGRPKDWQAYAYCGESLACLGQAEKSISQFQAACRHAPPHELGGALAWLGQVLLWLGKPAKAIAVLDRACGLGARYAFCSRAGAKIALGRPREALPDLDKAIDLKPWDLEAWVWRGEARRRLGDLKGSLQDLDHACGLFSAANVWALANRALTQLALGNGAAMRRDYDAIVLSPEVRYVRTRSRADARGVLEKLLALNRGYRDNLDYKSPVWMKLSG